MMTPLRFSPATFPMLLGLLLATPPIGDAAETVRRETDVAYLGPHRQEKGDLYLPASVSNGERFPAVVIIHGGGWQSGDKGSAREMNIGTTLASHGYVGFSINYVLAAKNRPVWPQNLYDCKTAVRWLRKNADRLHIDPRHIGVIGGSAGGHLAAMLAVTDSKSGLDPPAPYGDYSCRVQAAVDLYGPIDLTTFCLGQQLDLEMLPGTRAENPEIYRLASPSTYVAKGAPPILIIHGTADTLVPLEQSQQFAETLEKMGVPHGFITVKGAPHSFHLQPTQRDLRPAVLDFFDRYLKTSTTR
jgi:acetyl esterase/lipase